MIRNSEDIRIEITDAASSGGGVSLRVTNWMSHSKMCTSQCTEMSMSSYDPAASERYDRKYFISARSSSRLQVKSRFTLRFSSHTRIIT